MLGGVDPGTTTGIALLDLEGDVVSISSSRNCSLSDIVKYVIEEGNLLVLSTDVEPAPKAIEKLATMADAEIWEPKKSLSREEKKKITEEYDCSNKHEEDALAAVIKAYDDLKTKLSNIENRVPDDVQKREVKKLVIRGNSTKEAIEKIKRDEKTTKRKNKGANKSKRVKGLENKVKKLQDKVESLEEEVERKESNIKELKEELGRIKSRKFLETLKSKEVEARNKKIHSLKKELKEKRKEINELSNKLKSRNEIEKVKKEENKLVMKRIPTFTKKSIKKLKKEIGLNKNDVLYVEDASGGGKSTAKMVTDKIKGLAIEGKLSHLAKKALFKESIPHFNVEQLEIEKHGHFAVTNKSKLMKKLKEEEKKIDKKKKEKFKSYIKDELEKP
ncbi:MAG: putative nuclease of RNase H fold RuvC/YqgF family [Candidatus Methanohalarchaeum thermophilum]|uniref:Nuclease of RNase H fold RuvC/YqgF family n=1 Tax=Methanohalarchaeum thermophilum TaxID=1903181 RepID=A0A1Q6DXH0_METT1|nr:MAG: putative nuclease of RNase H fold RuvC/YqgF family [Candidatus Methanohalarchaeum thermophilum]